MARSGPKNYVCFGCRTTARRGFVARPTLGPRRPINPAPHCRGCGGLMIPVLFSVPSPKRPRAWDVFEAREAEHILENRYRDEHRMTPCAPAAVRVAIVPDQLSAARKGTGSC